MNTQLKDYTVPSIGDKFIVRGLVSASELNGKGGIVRRYDPKTGRYQVEIAHRDTPVAMKRENLALSEIKSPPSRNGTAMHVLIPCHVQDDHRVKRFNQCLESLASQSVPKFSVFIGLSGKPACRNQAMKLIRTMAEKKPLVNWFVLDDGVEERAQFEHYRRLLEISILANPNAWLMFLDNDDMFHPARVSSFKEFVTSPGMIQHKCPVFKCQGKLLLNSEKVGQDGVNFADIMALDKPLQELTIMDTEGGTVDNEYFDYGVQTSVLKRFMELTPLGITSHCNCDCRFAQSLMRLCMLGWHKNPVSWIAHYKVSQEAKNLAVLNGDIATYNNHASMSVKLSVEDHELARKFSLGTGRIAMHRRGVEEKVIQMYARNEKAERESKQEMIALFRQIGHPDLGQILWGQTCEQFASHFSKKMVQQNKTWWSTGNPDKEAYFGRS